MIRSVRGAIGVLGRQKNWFDEPLNPQDLVKGVRGCVANTIRHEHHAGELVDDRVTLCSAVVETHE